jgi:PKD domain/Domain of unknown function (DUF1735)
MKNNIFQYTKGLVTVFGFSALLYSCNKKDLVVDFNYPAATVGISQAAIATVGPGANGIFSITPKIFGQPYRYIADVAAVKFNVPIGIIKSGVNVSGSVSVTVAAITDTVTKLITAGKLPATTELLPAAAFTLPASADLADGETNGTFTLAVDLNFLKTNIAKKYAIAVGISSTAPGLINSKLSIAVIYIEPAQVLLPVANFSNSVDNSNKTAAFINLSANGVSYSWNYGDGSAPETIPSPSHKYAASGSYTITLTTTGITGTPSVKTTNITVL